LYYRLNVIPIHLPPLRERRGDVPILVEAFIKRFKEKDMTKLETVSEAALGALEEYPWQGNVRELENLIERMAILADGPELRLEDLPERFCGLHSIDSGSAKLTEPDIPEEGIDLRAVVDELENRLIEKALEKSGGVKNRAAQLLGLNRTTLVEKLKKKNLKVQEQHIDK
jgi:DNA-binding NtrC family response regulator